MSLFQRCTESGLYDFKRIRDLTVLKHNKHNLLKVMQTYLNDIYDKDVVTTFLLYMSASLSIRINDIKNPVVRLKEQGI